MKGFSAALIWGWACAYTIDTVAFQVPSAMHFMALVTSIGGMILFIAYGVVEIADRGENK